MSSLQAVKEFTKTAVIVDDGYVKIDVKTISGKDFSVFYNEIQEDNDAWADFKLEMLPSFPNLELEELISNVKALSEAWKFYSRNQTNNKYVLLLFKTLIATAELKISPLRKLVRYLEDELAYQVLTHPDIKSASDDIRGCKLLFLDFFLRPGSEEEMIQAIEEHKELLSGKVEVDGGGLRFVFLMSTQLPHTSTLERFRRVTEIRAALFKPVSKTLLERTWLEKELLNRVDRYKDIFKAYSFLDAFSESIKNSTNSLLKDIAALELHDLSVLNSIRLQAEQESPGEYLGWLFSEALAAKIRESSNLINARASIDDIQHSPFSGMLEPRSLLFDLYSEIAFSYPGEISISGPIRFGDVFQERVLPYQAIPRGFTKSQKASHSERVKNKTISLRRKKLIESQNKLVSADKKPDPNQVLLVISPACDLMRCSLNHEVMCVRGRVERAAPRLADLFDQKSVFGQDKHLMRVYGRDKKKEFALVSWLVKDVVTIKASTLSDQDSFQKRARMSELFCHEVKENALRWLGRVGVPVDPSFTVPLSSFIRVKVDKSYYEISAPNNLFISAVRVAGNNNNPKKIIFTEEFKTWLEDQFILMFNDKEISAPASKMLNHFTGPGGLEFTTEKKDESPFGGGAGKVFYFDDFSKDGGKLDFCVFVSPWSPLVNT